MAYGTASLGPSYRKVFYTWAQMNLHTEVRAWQRCLLLCPHNALNRVADTARPTCDIMKLLLSAALLDAVGSVCVRVRCDSSAYPADPQTAHGDSLQD